MSAQPELYQVRSKRVHDAIQLKQPDRVPLWFQDLSFFPANFAGISYKDAFYDSDKLFEAYTKTILYYQPDMYFNPGHAIHTPGQALEILGCQQIKWPGHGGLPPNITFQFVEEEYMLADEYPALLADPSDFTVRTYLPRIFTALKPFANLPPLKGLLMGYFGIPMASAYASREVTRAMESFYRAGLETLKQAQAAASFKEKMDGLGYPLSCGAITLTPFDIISDTLRGMKGTMLDMYRQPDNLLAAIDRLLPMSIDLAVAGAKASGTLGVFIPLHRGADGFMSLKQFEKFYWPGLKKILLALIDNGITPFPFFEGSYTDRLDYLAELPKGKILGLFDSTDIFKAKEKLGNVMCISGMMPLSLLQTGSHENIQQYTRKLIDVVGRDGGFIMGPRSAMDECDPVKVKVWVDYTREYGVYK
jgi:uroporphyrinogen-III decarboxylase